MELELAGRRLHVLERGAPDAPRAALLLHSSGLSSAQFASLARVLAGRSVRVLAPDLHGYGRSAAWPAEQRFEMALDVDLAEALLERLGGAPAVHVFGHSYGGYLALRLALRGHALRSLCVYEPAAFGLLGHGVAGAFDPEGHYTRPELRGREAWLELMVDFWNGPGAWRALPAARQRVMLASASKSFDEVEAVAHDTTPLAALAAIAAPTRVLVGAHTPPDARRVCELLAATLPHAELVTLAGAGHMAPILDAERVNALILEHLERCDPIA